VVGVAARQLTDYRGLRFERETSCPVELLKTGEGSLGVLKSPCNPMARLTHFIQSGAAKVGFITEDNYSDIGSTLGIAKLASADLVDAFSTVGNLLKSGQALRLRIRYKEGTKVKSASVICDIDKAAGAVAAIRGKNYSGGVILSASIPRRRRLG
jgi:hypothetical protein